MITVAELRRMRPTALTTASDDVAVVRRRLERSAEGLDDVARGLARSWRGTAGDAALRVARVRATRAAALVTAASGVGHGMAVGADGLAAARVTLDRARALAAEHGLRVTDVGAVVPASGGGAGAGTATGEGGAAAPGPASTGVAAQVRAMVRAALADAAVADGEATHLVRAALRALAAGSVAGSDRPSGPGDAPWRRGGWVTDAARVPAAGTAPSEVALWWAALPVATRTLLLTRHPGRLGNLDGIPLRVRALANRAVIVATLGRERRLAERLAGHADAGAALDACRERIRRYEDLIAGPTTVAWDADGRPVTVPGHQVVLFDPDGGRFAEVVGSIDARTTSIAVLVGGTGTDAGNMDGQYDRAMGFVSAARPPGSLAVITYLGGDMPQDLDAAAGNGAARLIGPRLADFAAGIDRPEGASLAAVGHSYGGSVIGAAEAAGLDVDRVVHVESAGAGPDVRGVWDYARPETQRYSMTAPGDPIALVQGSQLGAFGHGADPDLLDGVTRLETGYMRAGEPSSGRVDGPWAHSGVFTEGSTAWRNILDAMTGAPVLPESSVP